MAVIKDVAKLAGVSVAAVSKYLKTPGSMREDTRSRIEAAIRELDYKPSPLARSLRTRRTGMAAVMMPSITNPFFAELFDELRRCMMKNGFTALLQTAGDVDELRDAVFRLSIPQLDGILLCFLDDENLATDLMASSVGVVPLVAMSWHSVMEGCGAVIVDVRDGMRRATAHLIETGRRNIAYVGGPSGSAISREKHAGYLAALREADLPEHPAHALHGGYALESGYLAASQLLQGRQRPDAVAAENDALAVGCLKRFLQEGLQVPRDIAVTGFDDIPLSSMVEPPVTSVHIPIGRIAAAAADALAAMSGGNAPAAESVFQTTLVVRRSTDAHAMSGLHPRL